MLKHVARSLTIQGIVTNLQEGATVGKVTLMGVVVGKIILTPIVEEPKIYYEGSLLVVESESAGALDIIDALREERIQENLAW
ncbi:MAG: hypothetical protein F6J96_31435 [Symploca sp. SIO1C2]|nr:hypothetical protein [Symploca sp. SIO1C2]